MDAGRIYDNPFITCMTYNLLLIAIAVTRSSPFLYWLPKLQFPQGNMNMATYQMPTHAVSSVTGKKQQVEGSHMFYDYSLLLREILSLFSKVICYETFLKRWSRTMGSQCPGGKTCRIVGDLRRRFLTKVSNILAHSGSSGPIIMILSM